MPWVPTCCCAIRGRFEPSWRPRPFLKKRFPLPWSALFEDSIPLPDGRRLVALKDAASYITKLPEAEHSAPEWQAVSHGRKLRPPLRSVLRV